MDSERYKPLSVKMIFVIMVLLTMGAMATISSLSGGSLLHFTALLP